MQILQRVKDFALELRIRRKSIQFLKAASRRQIYRAQILLDEFRQLQASRSPEQVARMEDKFMGGRSDG